MLARLSSLGRSVFWRSSPATHQTTEETGTELSAVTQNPMNTGVVDLEANGTLSSRTPSEEEASSETPYALQPMSIAQAPMDDDIPEEELVAGVLHERINERFVNDHELRLMRRLPEASQLLEFITMITPSGVHQLALENKDNECRHVTCLIHADEFRRMFGSTLSHNLLVRAEELTDPNGVLLHDNTMTLKQLNQLEEAILNKQGHPLFGRSINEKTYLVVVDAGGNLLCGGTSKYPPVPEASSARLLHATRHRYVLTTTAALRLAAQTNLLINYLVQVYFDLHPNSGDDYTFYKKNIPMLLGVFLGEVLLYLLILHANPVNQSAILVYFERIRKIEQSVIGLVLNLSNYGPDLYLSVANIQTLFLPTILLGILLGCFTPLNDSVKNIAEYSMPKFILNNVLKSLTVGSFCAIGLQAPLNDNLFLYNNSLAAYNKLEQDDKMARYAATALTFIFLSMMHPNNPVFVQTYGRYTGNAMNSLGMVLLDNYALTSINNSAFSSFYGEFSRKEMLVPTLYRLLDAACLISVLLFTFPSTPNLGTYSTKKNTYKSPFFRRVEQALQPLSSCDLPFRTRPVITSDPITNSSQNASAVTIVADSDIVLAAGESDLGSGMRVR